MKLKNSWIGAVSGAVLASTLALGAQAEETSLATEQAPTTPDLVERVHPPTPTSCQLDLGNSAVGLEEYKIDANGDAGVFKSYGYLVPEAGAPENAEKEYTGCIYIHAEGNDRQVYGSLNLQNPDTESIFRRDFANTVRQVEEQQLRDARKAAAEADKHLTPQQKRCNRMARDIDEMGADGTITEMESKRILQITIGMRNAGCSM